MLDPRTNQVSPYDLPALGMKWVNTPVPLRFWGGINRLPRSSWLVYWMSSRLAPWHSEVGAGS